MTQRVHMSGQAGNNPAYRWEGTVITGPFKIPTKIRNSDEDYYVIAWDTWTGPLDKSDSDPTLFADIRAASGLTFI